MDQFHLSWSHGNATVFADGAALHHLTFDLGGRLFSPFAEAPWQDDYLDHPHQDYPRHLQLLGGEWACVPFGSSHHDPAHHGYGTDHKWQVLAQENNAITLGIEYPDQHMIKNLRRTISGVDGQAAIDLTLTLNPRKTGLLPIGLHPIFKLTEDLNIHVSKQAKGLTFPRVFEDNISCLTPNKSFNADGFCPSDHGMVNIFQTPCSVHEELVQIMNAEGEITLNYSQERTAIRLTWDAHLLPHCLLWISNKGRRTPPWNNQFQGIGVEPINSFFDINDEAPMPEDYGLNLTAGEETTITYRLAATPL